MRRLTVSPGRMYVCALCLVVIVALAIPELTCAEGAKCGGDYGQNLLRQSSR